MTCPRCGAVLLVRRTTATTWGHVAEERYECGRVERRERGCVETWCCDDTEELLDKVVSDGR